MALGCLALDEAWGWIRGDSLESSRVGLNPDSATYRVVLGQVALNLFVLVSQYRKRGYVIVPTFHGHCMKKYNQRVKETDPGARFSVSATHLLAM